MEHGPVFSRPYFFAVGALASTEMGGEPNPTFPVLLCTWGRTAGGKKFAAARQVGRAAAIAKERVWNKLSLSATIESVPEKL